MIFRNFCSESDILRKDEFQMCRGGSRTISRTNPRVVENLPPGLHSRDGASGRKSSGFSFFGFPVPTHIRSNLWFAGFADTQEAKAFRWVGVINIPVDGEGKQYELVCDDSSQPRETKTRIAGLTKYP